MGVFRAQRPDRRRRAERRRGTGGALRSAGGAEGVYRSRRVQSLGARRDDRPRHAVRTARAVRVLVTGGRGFIGARLVDALVDRGDKVRILDNGSRGEAAVSDAVETIEADVRDGDAVRRRVWGHGRRGAPRRRAGHGQLLLDAGGGARRQPPRRPEHCRRMCGCGGPTPGLLVVVGSVRHPSVFPTPESTPLVVPDPTNPRWSYGGSKIAASWSS